MKKAILVTTIAALGAIAAFFTLNTKPVQQALMNKIINMAVFTNNNYTADIYNASTAALSIIIKKAGAKQDEVVYSKSFPQLALKSFPTSVNAFTQAIEIPVACKDQLQVFYTLTYTSGGNVMKIEGNEVVAPRQENAKVSIDI